MSIGTYASPNARVNQVVVGAEDDMRGRSHHPSRVEGAGRQVVACFNQVLQVEGRREGVVVQLFAVLVVPAVCALGPF